MVSCLTVTASGRADLVRRSMRCFVAQTLAERELVIVHDGDADYHRELELLASEHPSAEIHIHRHEPRSLGFLRNVAVERARHDIVCQWDDDDFFHPERLEAQLGQLRRDESDFCFLVDQLHLFESRSELYWDDWSVEHPPMHLIQGTLLGKRGKLGHYADLPRGEDTPVVVDIARRGLRISEIRGRGYLYIYTFNGRNAWDFQHHAAQSAWKRYRRDRLAARFEELRGELLRYGLPFSRLRLPHDEGVMVVDLTG